MDMEDDDGIHNNGHEISTYEPLGNSRSKYYNDMDSPENDSVPPKDQKHIVYLALLTAGIGFVLPYNSFIIAADYWQSRFPGRSVALDMSMTYIIVAFATVLLNNVFLTLAPFRIRIIFGYAISFATLIFVALCEVAWHIFSSNTAYSVNLAAISLVAIGCTVQQSSFYGFASMLPKQYTQAVMAGESLAGFLVSSNRVVTKLIISSDRISTVIFFLTSTIYIAFSYILFSINMHSPFVRYHMKACAKIVLRPDENRLNDPTEADGDATPKYGVLPLDTSSSLKSECAVNTNLSFSNPVYELSNPTAGESIIDGLNNLPETSQSKKQDSTNVAYKVEHILTPGHCNIGRWSDLKNGFQSRWRVAQAIYPYMVCIALAYCVTLSLYPGIESEIISCSFGNWMPVLLMFTFNTSDVIGKLLAAVPYVWSRRQLILMSGLRIILVPLLLLCCAPRSHPVIIGEGAAFIFTIALGISNGLAGSLPMMLAPAKVPGTLKEVTGNMMTLSYNVGLTAGSLIGYVFESMLGAQLPTVCPTPYVASDLEQRNFTNSHKAFNITTATSVAAVAFTNSYSSIDTTPMATTATASTISILKSANSTILSTIEITATTISNSLSTLLSTLSAAATTNSHSQDFTTKVMQTTTLTAASLITDSTIDFDDQN